MPPRMRDREGARPKTTTRKNEVRSDNPQSAKPKKHRDPGDAPDGYDQTTWTLAIHFQAYAMADKIMMAQGLPVIHNAIRDLVDRYGIRDRTFHQVSQHCERRKMTSEWAAKCWYHYPPWRPGDQVDREIRWPEMVDIIMAEFWSRIQNEQCLAMFGDYFEEYGQACLDHWKSLRIIAGIEQQKMAGAMMPADSEEG